MKLIIDRFEGSFAVCEMPDKTMVNLPKSLLEGAAVGDVISITIDQFETENRKKEIERLMNDVWAD